MNDDTSKPGNVKPLPALTSDSLSDMVLDHLLSDPALYLGSVNDKRSSAERFTAILDSVNELALRVAKAAIANRTHLSALPVFAGEIKPDPETDQAETLYELRYRIVEQYGDNPPCKDDLYSFDEAVDIYGIDFVKRYWGELGERCPSLVTTSSNRQLWFTAVRFPVAELNVDKRQDASQDNSDPDGVLDSITRSIAPR